MSAHAGNISPRGQETHAYLICGPEGSGKRAWAVKSAGALLCTSQDDEKPCLQCPACVRVLAGSHPDLIELAAKKSSLGVDDIRALLLTLAKRPYEGGRRATIINGAQHLTTQAQNALLKTLEEPGASTFYLLTTDIAPILPTIRSRCRLVRMLPEQNLAANLIELGAQPSWAKELSLLCAGAGRRARAMLNDPGAMRCRDTALRMLALNSRGNVPGLWANMREEKEAASLILEWIECFCCDMLRAMCAATYALEDSRVRSAHFTIPGMRGIIEGVAYGRKLLKSNVSWQNVSEYLLLLIADAVCAESFQNGE